jgi:predicted XRE-type DNA-binding protein
VRITTHYSVNLVENKDSQNPSINFKLNGKTLTKPTGFFKKVHELEVNKEKIIVYKGSTRPYNKGLYVSKRGMEIINKNTKPLTIDVVKDAEVWHDEILFLKANISTKINNIIESRHLTQREAAKILKTQQPKISRLKNQKLGGFSVDQLFSFLMTLGCDIDIVIKKPFGVNIGMIRINSEEE